MKRYWVYVHTCTVNGKRYVGITTRSKPEYRWGKNGEGYQTNRHFYSAIQKHGWNNFQHEVWELTCESEMYYAEKYLIAYYHTTESEFGYNHSTGGEHGALGCIRSEESRKKMSEIRKGKPHKPHSEETKRKIAEVNRKSHSDPEYRKHMAEAQKERWLDPEYRRRQSEIRKGKPRKPHSEEAKKRIAEAMKGKSHSEEHIKHISEAKKGKPLSEEHKKHLSEAKKGKSCKPFSEEHRKHISENSKKKWADPEYRRKVTEAAKNRPKVKIKLPDGTIVETTKNIIVRWYVNKGREFEYLS